MKNHRELVGYIAVDAGCVYIGDPCYEIGSGARSKFPGTWLDFCKAILHTNSDKRKDIWRLSYANDDHDDGKAIIVTSGYGDGVYPVYVERENGIIVQVIVDFSGDSEDD